LDGRARGPGWFSGGLPEKRLCPVCDERTHAEEDLFVVLVLEMGIARHAAAADRCAQLVLLRRHDGRIPQLRNLQEVAVPGVLVERGAALYEVV
jgi:hypothetical protein